MTNASPRPLSSLAISAECSVVAPPTAASAAPVRMLQRTGSRRPPSESQGTAFSRRQSSRLSISIKMRSSTSDRVSPVTEFGILSSIARTKVVIRRTYGSMAAASPVPIMLTDCAKAARPANAWTIARALPWPTPRMSAKHSETVLDRLWRAVWPPAKRLATVECP